MRSKELHVFLRESCQRKVIAQAICESANENPTVYTIFLQCGDNGLIIDFELRRLESYCDAFVFEVVLKVLLQTRWVHWVARTKTVHE